MRRLVMLEVEVRDDEHLRQVARSAAYGAWSVAQDPGRWDGAAAGPPPVMRVAVTEHATRAIIDAWDAL